MTDFDKRILKKLQLRAEEYIQIRKDHALEGVKIAKLGNEIYSSLERFWSKHRKNVDNL